MQVKITHRDNCRLCSSKDLKLILSLTPTPVGDRYVTSEKISIVQECHSLDFYVCRNCGLIELLDIVEGGDVYVDYIYRTSDSLGLVSHFESYANDLPPQNPILKDTLVIDIGSNDGSFLRFFKNQGYKVLGIDPAREAAAIANQTGIETINNFFTEELAKKIKRDYGTANIVTANNTLANIDDLQGFINGIKKILAPNGIFAFETGYVYELLNKKFFDYIYHEHISYFSVTPLQLFFQKNGLELVNVSVIPSKGGSIRCIVKRKNSSNKTMQSVDEMIKVEAILRKNVEKDFSDFSQELGKIKNQLSKTLDVLKSQGKKIAGYGASVGVTTMIYHFNLSSALSFLVDDNTRRQGLYSPGLHIPVKSPDEIYKKKIDYVVILAWMYSKPIMQKHKKFLEQGGHFIIPLPELRII